MQSDCSSKQMAAIPLPYISRQSKYKAFECLLRKDWAMLLDSGSNAEQSNVSKAERYRRHDILVYKPTVQLTFDKNKTLVSKLGSSKFKNKLIQAKTNGQDPIQIMRKLLAEYAEHDTVELSEQSQNVPSDIPFNGGWLGYISYDFGYNQGINKNTQTQYKSVPDSSVSNSSIPEIQMGLYQWALITDHQQKTSAIYNFGLTEFEFSLLEKEIKTAVCSDQSKKSKKSKSAIELSTPFTSNISAEEYADSFNKIQDYILTGDCYQVNFAQQFTANFKGDSLSIYQILAKENNAPFSAYLNFGSQQIISLSPERFIESHRGKVTTQPIKGTRPRSKDAKQDSILAKQLANSDKDKAENLMIVDLLRNDLSKTAKKASVEVTELFGLYHFESVHHLISTVTSKLKPGMDNFDLLKTTLPGGSITGAPKIRAMQIINELETFTRGIYCGVIGYLDFIGNMDTNICIRTLLLEKEKIVCCAGGGIVADSQLELEYQETFDKLNKILPVLNKFHTPQ